ncbi:[protein-PII] uridylyltransferase [Marinomonas rhizomae]|uniref:Bifunctional uridylyltransferase/uridylyl-removing enzyme n=1 Tax=Marinomonas rhizomae TaxID=491948 RepID=A0A366J4C2_9GAMM|nr:[protein-PII] uridylyltransferase [Marinomonas rhizomae]RBP81883.1 UTP--GlnB (protein PII) uridylyltransferase GlnD [Marinomonas rhizomae]RNF72999.1 [protein-PII] uridylyltransferase [Marinomonas rhizomae]
MDFPAFPDAPPLLTQEEKHELAQPSCSISHYKAIIEEKTNLYNDLFHSLYPIEKLVKGLSSFYDEVMQAAWISKALDCEPHVSLVAVGGYGRGELHPKSDIDLLILMENETSAPQHKIEAFITFLWDINLDVGHSVRTINECAEMAEKDITIITNLIESRTLIGPIDLLATLKLHVDTSKMWDGHSFYQAKLAEQKQRHAKYQNTAYNLEPNLKECPGGLRDMQVIDWVAKRHLHTHRLSALIDKQFLSEDEYIQLKGAVSHLWRVRWALHMVAGRKEDRLLFDHQRTLTKLFGFDDDDLKRNVERFMQGYYQSVAAIQQLNDLLLQHFEESFLAKDAINSVEVINNHFQIANGQLEARSNTLFQDNPSSMLEIYVLLGAHENIRGIRANTMRQLRDSLDLIDDDYRNNKVNTDLFLDIIASRYRLTSILRSMKHLGLLGRYLPEFGAIIGQMQHDLFHIYTVDAHTLQLVENLRRLWLPEFKQKFPISAQAIRHVAKVELLYIAGLYHDIAKGRGGDHSELGCVDAQAFCERHGLSKQDTDLVVWLVRNHLFMSVTAQRKDISDPEVIWEFASYVKDQERLDYLFILTVADINATNPTMWNSWRASLMRQLYLETKRALRRGLDFPIDADMINDEHKQRALEIMIERNVDIMEAETIWETIEEEYFIRSNGDEIAWNTEAILRHRPSDKPLIAITPLGGRNFSGASKIFIYTLISKHLFAVTAATFEQLGLTILDAKISHTTNNYSLDSFVVMDSNDSDANLHLDKERITLIRKTLMEQLETPSLYESVVQRHTPRILKIFNSPSTAHFVSQPEEVWSALEITAPDRPGLLALVGQFFMNQNIMLHKAKIATLGERVEDTFYITEENGDLITDPEAMTKICTLLKEKIDRFSQAMD